MNSLSSIAKTLGSKGGNKTKAKYGRKHFVAMGKKSGEARRKKLILDR